MAEVSDPLHPEPHVEPQHPGHRKDQQDEVTQESKSVQDGDIVPENKNEVVVQNISGGPDEEESTEARRHSLVEKYSGPSVHDMISSHTLAENIIKYGSDILDDQEMALLKRFVNDPDSRDQILQDVHIEDVDGVMGQYHGSLAGFIVMRHKSEVGETVEPVLTNEEIEALKEWFRAGEEGSAGVEKGSLRSGSESNRRSN